MFKGIKNAIQRRKLMMEASAIEKEVTSKKQWGNNLTTALITTNLISENLDILDQNKFVESKRGAIVNSYFPDFISMYSWLSEVNTLLNDFAYNGLKQIPDDKSGLNLANKHEVPLMDFIQNNGMVINLVERYQKISKLMLSMENSLNSINHNSRGYLDMRLSNGLNTLITINEQLLEVMING